jgi:mRNA-degrading endonuclease RelE of RelBE toxin-antitoxin system
MVRKEGGRVAYKVRLAPGAMAEINRLSGRAVKYINDQLGKRPETVGVPLSGQLKGCLAFKYQQYRIIYRVDHAAATVDILRVM